MKNIKKPVFFIITAFVLIFSYLTLFGISSQYGDKRTIYIKGVNDIRWGIDIRGGVDVTFTPPENYEGTVTNEDIDAAQSVIVTRMMAKNITDYESYADYNSNRIIVRFPWQSSDTSFDPEAAVNELGETALLSFYKGETQTEENLVLTGADVSSAGAFRDQDDQVKVSLELKDSGKQAFAEATAELSSSGVEGGVISIWMDDVMISAPRVKEAISGGNAVITGGGVNGFEPEEAKELADKINGGALPFKLETENFSVIEPTMGMKARDAMAMAGVIAFILMCIYVIIRYKIPGVIAAIGLTGQVFGSLAVISGFFGVFDSFTLTIPGIAGIILSIGMGVDANVITAERIKEELRMGKTLDGAVQSGYKRAFSAIFDGNATMVLVAFILMGAFGTPGSFASTLLSPFFFLFGASAEGTIYSFGYTLIIGVVLNFIFGVFASRLMTYSITKFKAFRKPSLFGGYSNEAQKEKDQSKKVYDAVANKTKFLSVPIVIAAIAVSMTLILGLEMAIDFKGGTILNYSYEGEIDADTVKATVESGGFGTVNVKKGSAVENSLSTLTIEFASKNGLTSDVQSQVTGTLETAFAQNNLKTAGSQDVNPTMGRSFFLKCLVAVLLSFLVLMVYVALRFKNVGGWSAGFFTIVALLINVMIVYAAFVFFRFTIDANFIAVVLTILCYTINDTIVVFDRIRENRELRGSKSGTNSQLVNKSISQSFARSLNTTVTTCISMIAIIVIALIRGIDTMLSFAVPMLCGLVIGFITSLYIAGPLWASWKDSKDPKNLKTKK